MSTISYNVRLLIQDNEVRNYWLQYLEFCKLAYNDCSKLIIENCSHTLSLKEVHKTCYYFCRENYPELPAQAIIKIYKDVISAIRSIKKNKHKNPTIPFKKNGSCRLDKRLYSNLTRNTIKLSSGLKNKRIDIPFQTYKKFNNLANKFQMKDPLLFVRNNELWLSIPFEIPETKLNDKTCIGIDLGIRRFITTSTGYVYQDKKYLAKRRQIRYLKRCLKAKNTKSAKRHLKLLKKKETNIAKANVYKMVNTVLEHEKASIYVLEDLRNIKQSTSRTEEGFKRTKHNNRFSQVPVAKFKEILTYKALLNGKKVETVSPKYTSQYDSRTGKRDGIRKGCRYYCKDGTVLDADWNAAINIAKRSKHQFSHKTPIDGNLCLNCRVQSTTQTRLKNPNGNS